MKPTQKQPEPLKNVPVTREALQPFIDAMYRNCRGGDAVLIEGILNERDEAIREVEILKAKHLNELNAESSRLQFQVVKLREEVERLRKEGQAALDAADAEVDAEKRRTAALERELENLKAGHQ